MFNNKNRVRMTDSQKIITENARLKEELEDIFKKYEEVVEQNDELRKLNLQYSEEIKALPKKLEKELKDKESKFLRFKMVTVLFSQVRGFTKLAETENPEALIDELDKFYFQFDTVVAKYNIEKINAIGDTYISAGGIPKKNRTNPFEVVMAALEMQQYMKKLQIESQCQNKKIWDLSFGIHTGPVTASPFGKKKISYDIKGETVNSASRIEASSDASRILISDMTYELIQEFFRCEYVGKLPVKYQGDMSLYTVKGFRPEYSEDDTSLIPNKKFKIRFQIIKYDDLEEFMLDKLERELPKHLFYHNLKHTIDVVIQVELIGRSEGLNDEELLLMRTAGLFHDAGHIIQSPNHEYYSTVLAREILPEYGYSTEQIDIICDTIMATQLPPKPTNLMQNIICDADLDYLGRTDFIPVSETLYKELNAQKIITDYNVWNNIQIKFLSGHHYFTDTANKLREVNKQKQIDRIKSLIVE
ncbi:MAG: hypothetical protein A2033_01405 [Bacteroidetes bacterium GWA2_31_9]|nr:MAG: hypothetical protein A2033_01405 [Bacteroidetes bacterium GWA2_31_9]